MLKMLPNPASRRAKHLEMRASAEDAGRGSGVKGGGEKVRAVLVCGMILIVCSVLNNFGNADIKLMIGFIYIMLAQIGETLEKIEKNQRSSWFTHRQ